MKNGKDPLAILFGSAARVKLLRLFLFNPNIVLSFNATAQRARLVRRTARTELNALERAGVVKRKQVFEDTPGGTKKRRTQGYTLNTKFPYFDSLQGFLFDTTPLDGKTVLKHLRKAGKIDLVVITGVFTKKFDQRLDLIVSAAKLQEGKLEQAVQALEAELGIEIRYAAFANEDFMYRVGMHDKLTRDVFDYPYHILVDKIGLRNELS